MASILATYQSQERLDEIELAHRLSIDVTQVPRLALCKRPLSESSGFAEQVRQIASYTGSDQTALAQIIRQVDALEQLHDLPATDIVETEERHLPSPSGLMAAARDREESDTKPLPDDKPEDNSEPSS
jgi:hypothetical protein